LNLFIIQLQTRIPSEEAGPQCDQQECEIKIMKLYSECLSHGMQNSQSVISQHTLSDHVQCKWWVGRQWLYWLTRWLLSQSRNSLITWQWQISHGSPSPTLTRMMPTGAIHCIQTIYLSHNG